MSAFGIGLELLTPEEMGRADRLTIEGGVSGIDLMENAGRAVAAAAMELAAKDGLVVVLAGPGNNGGDGFIAARILAAAGYRVDVRLLADPAKLKGDALAAYRRMGLAHKSAAEGDFIARDLADVLKGASLIIDALFGAGLDRDLSGPVAEIVRFVNDAGVPVLAVDLPSGVGGAGGAILGDAIKARASITFFRKKPGHLLFPGKGLCGELSVADIGILPEVLDDIVPETFENAPGLWLKQWPVPDAAGHKYARGHALVFGGPVRQTGAARLSAGAALRAGAGLVTLVSPPDAVMVNACHLTAVMLKKLPGPEAIPELLSDARFNALLIGPGYGVGETCREVVAAVLLAGRATVLDADALTSFSECPDVLFGQIRANSAPVILTPHAGEFSRLFPGLPEEKLAAAREAAAKCGAVVILKGADTVIAAPDGRAAINTNAPPWLATAGSGDVLAGIATALLAQGVPGFEAACQAVWLHGEAANAAGPGLIAEDLERHLQPVLRELSALAAD